MKTELKNQWIALEEKYQATLNEKVEVNNSTSIKQPNITSQLTFCTDGVQIRRYINPDFQKGISVKSYKKTLAEMKLVDDFANKTLVKLDLPIVEYGVDEFDKFEAFEIEG
ncbi:hypothetical protein [Brumimicrobium mesophilum]|uniref:hypothetical protein n=1 Tax=Brumimicrobium mesophilum TaxID=392717 RepID=UPI000D141694|nr:hypothetical protein [Brumimicrobium mesophilum]